ncbi:hypothetical protein JG687_00014162, partial [Phytophthora cactorum]
VLELQLCRTLALRLGALRYGTVNRQSLHGQRKQHLADLLFWRPSNSHSPLTTRRRDRSSNRSKRSARLRPQRLHT